MDITHFEARLKWLDEERRKDKAEIAGLQQRVIGAENAVREATKRILELESQVVAQQAQITKMPRMDDSLEKVRREIVAMIEEQDERRRASEREAEKLRRVELENQAKSLAEFKRELVVIPRIQEEVGIRKAEEQRLNAILATLTHQVAQVDERVDERIRDVSYLEESRRQDSRRLAEVGVELSELRKRVDTRLPKIEVLEDQIVRTHARVSELTGLEVDRKQDHTKFIEQYSMLFRERDRRLEAWAEQIEEARTRTEDYARRIQAYGELQQVVNAALAQLEGLRQRLEQRQNEVSEMQRLSEDRLKTQWQEFIEEQDKRWRHMSISYDERWRDHDRRHVDIPPRLQELAAVDEQLRAELARIWRLQEAHAQTMTTLSREWLEDFQEVGEKKTAAG